jgi:hypothetical protein
MNWSRAALAAVVGGVVMWILGFVLHGLIMSSTYMKYPDLFVQENGNPFVFLIVELFIAFPAAVIFARTRGSWSPGLGGGLAFGFWLGLVGSFAQLFNPIVFQGFPYYLGWCWWGINLITALGLGATLGLVIRTA